LDIGCGTGALTSSILERAAPSLVVGVDASPAFVTHTARHFDEDVVAVAVADAHSLPLRDDAFDLCVSALVLNFLAAPVPAMGEMRRVVRSGGTIAAYVWDYADRMEFLRVFWESARALDPAAGALDEGRRFPIAQPDALSQLFRRTGLNDVAVRSIEIETSFRDFDDLWSPFLGGQGPAPAYVATLDERARARLAEHLRAKLPIEPDGAIALVANAWCVRGSVP
jgi:SAM-dependent methyltransferase